MAKDLDKSQFSKNLNHLMRVKRLSLSKLSREVGMNKSTLHNYMNGVLPQNLVNIKELADYLQIPLSELLFGEKPESISVQISGDLKEDFIVTIHKNLKK